MKRILIAAGGTGGHVLPAEALAKELQGHDAEVFFVGSGLSKNSFFNRSDFRFQEIKAMPLSLKHPLQALMNLKSNLQGLNESRRIINTYRPDVVVGFGSYHTAPILLASVINATPIVLHAPDTHPGKTIRFFSSFAKVSGIQFPEASKLLRCPSVLVEHPLREGYKKGASNKREALSYFGLDSDKFTFLVFGGSQGAAAINELFKKAVLEIKDKLPAFQVIHFTGNINSIHEYELFYKTLGIKSYVKPFEKRMDLAFTAADLCITRAGAGSIAEQMELEVPGILIPYPYSSERHQEKNADFMTWDVGGSIKLLEYKATPHVLANKILDVMKNNYEKLTKMKVAIQFYKKNADREALASVVLSIAEGSRR